MLAETAAGAFVGYYRIHTIFQPHGPPLDGAAFITAAAEQMLNPGKTLFPVQFGKTHPHLLNGYIMQGIRWADGRAAHTEVAGCLFGIDLRGTSHKKIKPPPHLDTVKDTDLGTLAALQATGEKLLFIPGPGRSEKMFIQLKHDRVYVTYN